MLNRLQFVYNNTITKDFIKALMKDICKEYSLDYKNKIEKQICNINLDIDNQAEIIFLCNTDYETNIKCNIDFDCNLVESSSTFLCIEMQKNIEKFIEKYK